MVVISVLSFQVIQISIKWLKSLHSNDPREGVDDVIPGDMVKDSGGPTIFAFSLARFVICLTLTVLSTITYETLSKRVGSVGNDGNWISELRNTGVWMVITYVRNPFRMPPYILLTRDLKVLRVNPSRHIPDAVQTRCTGNTTQ